MEKRIETVELPACELKGDPENPRKITKKKREELRQSLEDFGDFGVIVIDENNKIISGQQRVDAMVALGRENEPMLCKRLLGYTRAELKAINIKANTHAGDWDLDKLASWQADIGINLGLDIPNKDPGEDIKVKDMELIRFEKYDYVIIACKTEPDYLKLVRDLGLEDKKVIISRGKNGDRKIKARAIWYDDLEVTPKGKSI